MGYLLYDLLSHVGSILSGGQPSITGAIQSLTGIFSQVPQNYFQVPFPNQRLALYRLTLLASSQAVNSVGGTASFSSTPGLSGFINGDYTDQFVFPLSPASLTRQYINLSVYYDVRGTQAQNGVNRIVDQYGMGPPIIAISGTTGYQYHSMDGFQWTGRDSINRLNNIISEYAFRVTEASEFGFPMPLLVFEDSYIGDAYIVIPFQQQSFNMDNSRPIVSNYALQLLAIQTLSAPLPSIPDPITQVLVQGRGLLASTMVNLATAANNDLTHFLGLPNNS
jgi:hypothetical protein